MVFSLLIFFSFVLPFVFWQGVYEGYKILLFWLGSFLLITYILVNKKKRDIVLGNINNWDIFYWLWIVLLTTSSLIGVHPLESLVGGSYRHQGVIFFISAWLVGKSLIFLSPRRKKLFKNVVKIVFLFESILLVLQLILSSGLLNGRPIGSFGEPNAAGGFLAFSPFFLTNPLILLITCLGIIVSQSRSALLFFFVALFGKFKFRAKGIVVMVLFFVLSVISIFYLREFGKPAVVENRLSYWKHAYSSFLDRPLLGYGAESGEVVFEREYLKDNIILGNFMVDRSHNLLIDITMWSGILGLFTFGIFLFGSLLNTFKTKKQKKFYTLLGFLLFSFFQPLGVVHWILFFIVLNL